MAKVTFTSGYTARDVAKLLGLTVPQIRGYVRAGFLSPRNESADGATEDEDRFSFQDLILLRTARDLSDRVPPRKIARALGKLRDQLPSGRPLSAVRITAEGDNVVVRDGSSVWEPESGQALLDFNVSELASKVAPLARVAAEEAGRAANELTADEWYDLGCDLETCALEEARDAYRRALEIDPRHPGACVNLGRILHDAGRADEAEEHYRRALEGSPADAIAAFNLGIALEDLGRPAEAIQAYERALGSDPDCVDAHFNVARLYERVGNRTAAFRHLTAYRELTQHP